MKIKYDKKLIPDVPQTASGEMGEIALAMIQVMKNNYLNEIYADERQAIDQALRALNNGFNNIRLLEINE